MHLAGLIIAQDEAAVIGETVRHFRTVAPGSVPLLVVADRCHDATAAAARAYGATVLERFDGRPGKGAALAWTMEHAGSLLDGIDGVVILDADSRLRSGAIERLSAALTHAVAAQAFVMPVPPPNLPAAVLAAYSELLSQTIDDRLRFHLGWPVPLRGTGSAIRLTALREVAPYLRTRVEDIELTLLLAAQGGSIVFVQDAVVEDPKPRREALLSRQRARWLLGQREVWRYHRGAILRVAATRGPAGWWLIQSLLFKPRTFVIAAKLLALLVLLPFWTTPVLRTLGLLVAASLALNAAYYLAGLALIPSRERQVVVPTLVHAPRYFLMFLRAWLAGRTARTFWQRSRD